MGRRLTAAGVAGLTGVVLYVMLDSRLVTPEAAAPLTSLSLGGMALLFGAGAWAMQAGGQPGRVPLLTGLALGLGAYALLRLAL